MLEKKNDSRGWSVEEMLQEQLAFQIKDGKQVKFSHIVHYDTDKKYYAYELAEAYLQREEKKRRIERLKKRKELAFSGEKLNKLKQDRKAGMSIRALANKYNCSTRTIQKYLKVE